MAEEAVVKEILTTEMVKAGDELTRSVDKSGMSVSASLWLYLPDSNLWRLILASPEVGKFGPKKVYERIQTILSKTSSILELKDISVVEDNNSLISLLRVAIRTGDGISGIRFKSNTINGHYIEDAYIYRLA